MGLAQAIPLGVAPGGIFAAPFRRAPQLPSNPELTGAAGGGGNRGGSIIYREGGQNPGNLKPQLGKEGVSFRDSLSNPYPKGKRPVFSPGHEYIEVDPSRLPPGSVIWDDVPPGHVDVVRTPPDVIRKAIIKKGRFPP
jgi:hypothetical protein